MRRLVVLVSLVTLLVVAPVATAGVYLVGITPSVHRGGYVTLAVDTIVTVRCSVRVHHGSDKPLVDPALAARQNHQLGALRWRWRMPVHSARGRWSVEVVCGSAGRLHTTFAVL